MLEIETEPLTEQPARQRENHDNLPRFHLSPRWQKFLVVLAIAFIFMLFYDTETAEENIAGGVSITKKKNGKAPTIVTAKVLGGEKLLQLVTEQKARFEAQKERKRMS